MIGGTRRSRLSAPILLSGACALSVVALASGACRNWDAYDPRLGSGGHATGGASGSSSTGGASTASSTGHASSAGSTGSSSSGGGSSSSTSPSTSSGGGSPSASASSSGGGASTASASSSGGGASTASASSTSSASSSSSSSSTGGPAPCGKFDVLADSFPGSDPGGLWAKDEEGGTVDVETGGEAVVTPPSGQAAGSFGAFRTNRFYDLRNSTFSVKVNQTTNTATTATTYMNVGLLDGTQIAIFEKSGHIGFSQQIGATNVNHKSIPYDPTMHLYWRVREDGTNTYWETSADGSTWVTQAQVATTTLFPLQYVNVELGMSTDGGEVNPGAAHFADVNGGGTPTGKWCPVASITDDFTSTTQSIQWYRSYI